MPLYPGLVPEGVYVFHNARDGIDVDMLFAAADVFVSDEIDSKGK